LQRASREVSTSRSIVCRLLGSLLISLRQPVPACFHAFSRLISANRPLIQIKSGSFFHEVLPLQSSFFPTPCSRLSGQAMPIQGFFPTRGAARSSHSTRGVPLPRYVTSSGFLNLSTFCSATWFCRLISSYNHVQGSFRSGVSLFVQPSFVSEGACPLVVAVPNAQHLAISAAFGTFDFEALFHTK